MRTRILVVAALLACLASLGAMSIGVSDAHSGTQTVGHRTGPLAVSLALLSSEAEDLRVAKKDAFDSISALTQARAESYGRHRAPADGYSTSAG